MWNAEQKSGEKGRRGKPRLLCKESLKQVVLNELTMKAEVAMK